MAKLFANRGDPDHMLHSVASDMDLHCLPVTLLGVSRLKWVQAPGITAADDISLLLLLLLEKIRLDIFYSQMPS